MTLIIKKRLCWLDWIWTSTTLKKFQFRKFCLNIWCFSTNYFVIPLEVFMNLSCMYRIAWIWGFWGFCPRVSCSQKWSKLTFVNWAFRKVLLSEHVSGSSGKKLLTEEFNWDVEVARGPSGVYRLLIWAHTFSNFNYKMMLNWSNFGPKLVNFATNGLKIDYAVTLGHWFWINVQMEVSGSDCRCGPGKIFRRYGLKQVVFQVLTHFFNKNWQKKIEFWQLVAI